ncbi:MAG: hypothetical protein ACLU3I_05505 [Acutalibacteraceae bacterium]
MIRRLRPSRSAFCAITWIFFTNGQVASTVTAPRVDSVRCSPTGDAVRADDDGLAGLRLVCR